ncbi:hypothetical protein GGU11DRAFT_745287 [Lentinula aff. detonsa]|uniref:Uncharacterized protein n=1 Tax=Lentinula aff. detonsa TaxID=2804958 RepID=A0AA38NK13_9AGAR|nr:hypothetical protein GGU10DRAFT_410062 [Lentinula aff. detonsa]KAJ3797343.1 hypothetical protein GGU11DRAFT_745287 [Lentinula aff. detonsa]
MVVGGISPEGSVGAAGNLGGRSQCIFSSTGTWWIFNVLITYCNSRSLPDLFWALRGGGDGTYGVLTSVTYKTYAPNPLTFIATSRRKLRHIRHCSKSAVSQFVRFTLTLIDLGWGGYAFMSPELFTFTVGETLQGGNANGTRRIEDKPKGYFVSLEGLVGPDGGAYLNDVNSRYVFYEFYPKDMKNF